MIDDGYREMYSRIKNGGTGDWDIEGKNLVSTTDKCMYYGGDFHVSTQAINN